MNIKTIEQLQDEFAQSHDFENYLDYQDALTLSESEWRGICIKYADQFIDAAVDIADGGLPIQSHIGLTILEELRKINK